MGFLFTLATTVLSRKKLVGTELCRRGYLVLLFIGFLNANATNMMEFILLAILFLLEELSATMHGI